MSHIDSVASFVEGAPPGEVCVAPLSFGLGRELTLASARQLADVVADIKTLTLDSPNIVSELAPAFEKYNEEQFTTVKLPGSSQQVVISSHNSLGGGRYFDVESSSSFAFDHTTQKASAVQSYVVEGAQAELTKSTLKSLGSYANEHFPNAAYGVYPVESDSKIAIVIVSNKYSPNNYWNGRWRSLYIFDPASGSLDGSVKVDVHYYEDGNVRLLTNKTISAQVSSGTGAGITKEIAVAEKKYQEDLNKGFVSLSEGAFKGLRRQLPVTRQKIEWDKVTGYRLGQDIGGGSGKR
ncbi:F-actin-capping protein subunit alpha [Paramyrothecium foliicola]|nr:F-actin-capping protein subunit alpha [Paramyrothecium foliicola]